jgi:hypothetical protein
MLLSSLQQVIGFLFELSCSLAPNRSFSHKKPKHVFSCTHDSDMPQKALTKHALIAHVFNVCGYVVTREDKQLGKESWWMELPDPSAPQRTVE